MNIDILLTRMIDIRGESAYNDISRDVVEDLKRAGLAAESEGAVCVFPEGFKNKEGEPLPFIIQKSDGAFLYATTDLAALRYRVAELKADEIVYVTDARQAQHFAMLFAVARKAGWAKESTELVHVTFGTMLGTDGKPFKTRSGETVKLKELLEEAVQRARGVVEAKNPELPEDQKQNIARAVGIGAVKYSDYSNNRDSDYVFSFEKMLAMEGNTAPYMQYAYARVRSIERKAESRGIDVKAELAGLVGSDAAGAGGDRPGQADRPLRRGDRDGGAGLSAQLPDGLPLRVGAEVQQFLQRLPGAGRRRADPGAAAAAVRPDGRDDPARAVGAAGHRSRRTDVRGVWPSFNNRFRSRPRGDAR